MRTIENLGTTRLLLIIIGILITYTLNGELRALTAPSGTNCVGRDFALSAKDEGQRHNAVVESLLIATESAKAEASEYSDVGSTNFIKSEQPGNAGGPPGEGSIAHGIEFGGTLVQPGRLRQRHLNLKPILTGEPRSWESMGNITRKLNFLHIPKAGGTSIFLVAAQNGLSWAECLFPSGWRAKMCPDAANTINAETWPDHPYQAPWWHTPVQYLPTNQNPYDNHDLFAVVRNPYDRAVSEYYYYCNFNKRACFGTNNEDTPDRLNSKLQQLLWTAMRAPMNSSDYFQAWGHWIPQYDYFYNTTSRTQERLVPHLLHNEYLNEEFDSLMRAYGLNFTLPQKRSRSRQDLGAQMTTADLTEKTMKLIDIVFEKDFILGNYAMLTGKLAGATTAE